MSKTHEQLHDIKINLPGDFKPYGNVEREACSDCSCGCKHFEILGGEVTDWGVCTNDSSHRAGLLTFEHQGCTEFELEINEKLLHRDDIPMDIAEDIVEKLQELHPDAKIVFAGDMPDDDPAAKRVAANIIELERSMDATFFRGLCWDCGKQIPAPWPPACLVDGSGDDTEIDIPEGWHIEGVSIEGNGPLLLSCPACRDKEPDSVPKPVEVPMGYKVGIRVGAIEYMNDDKCRFIGYGEYLGDEVPPESVGIGMPNPKIRLDNGQIYWGCECWWAPEDEIKTKIEQHHNVELVVDVDRPKE